MLPIRVATRLAPRRIVPVFLFRSPVARAPTGRASPWASLRYYSNARRVVPSLLTHSIALGATPVTTRAAWISSRTYSDGGPGPRRPPNNIPPFPRPPADKRNPESINASSSAADGTSSVYPPGGTPNTASRKEARAGQFDTTQPELSGATTPEANNASVAPESSSIPKTPLPDLRQGIPSTFEDEFLKKSQGSERPPIDITDADPETSRSGGGGRGDGEIPKGAYESSIDKKRNALANYIALTVLLMGLGGTLYLGRNWDNEAEERAHSEAPSGWGFKLFYDRVMARVSGQMGYYTEPAFPKLLPVLTDQPTPPYTLVISLEDMLVHSEWTREHGWRTAKRPGADFFLLYLSQYYEICLFTSMPSATADPIYRRLDPYHVIMWPLFREATRYENGEYIKDLSYLNRPLSRTILVDTKSSHASAQPENAIILPPWKGDPKDRDLASLVPFLEYMAAMGIDDVREALKSFDGKHIPTEFAAREARMRAEHERTLAAKNSGRKRRSASSGLGMLAGSLGMKPGQQLEPGAPNISEALAEGRMLSDLVREDGMRRYKMMQKEIRDNGEKWLKEEAEMEKKMQDEGFKDMKSKWFGLGGGAGTHGGGASSAAINQQPPPSTQS